MINGSKQRQVAKYLPIDHCSEGYGFEQPRDGETFMGCPWGWYVDSANAVSPPVIEVIRDGEVIRTINALDLAEIHFAAAETAADEEGGGDADKRT